DLGDQKPMGTTVRHVQGGMRLARGRLWAKALWLTAVDPTPETFLSLRSDFDCCHERGIWEANPHRARRSDYVGQSGVKGSTLTEGRHDLSVPRFSAVETQSRSASWPAPCDNRSEIQRSVFCFVPF